ncbi:MAG TPA: ABC transporter ATP-binding protein [Desulfovibrio sp.]|uniref:ABC transporter ATP-binding protein n=1 Tax=Desulfovibrio sp. TaxID=885 RepID=UPI002A424C67|nr:ABC transporter ATP-binding protein [Desulfovibrio sp.]MDY0305501.1 ABC transporter ATP-binding protein [Desulfovibrionaceae bacterium]HMM39804.1 ABC transporter ATP-binding protein [Desulfovibrio sp.]
MAEPLLSIQELCTDFLGVRGQARAVDGVSLDVLPGETLALVGESGCGKTVLALSVLRLIPDPPGRVTSGRALFRGRDLLALPEAEMRGLRGSALSMVFQEPMTSLNPVFRVGEQIAETLRLHKGLDRKAAWSAAVDMLDRVGIPAPAERAASFPHEMSGGMRQRVMIAMALACDPDLLLADEPTTALDVTIQAQILDLLVQVRERRAGGATLLITHDLGVVARAADRVAVMYAGQILEQAQVGRLFKNPLHPYAQGLLASLPRPGSRGRLTPIPGTVPSIFDLPRGCRFHPRCPKRFQPCDSEAPPLFTPEAGHDVRCWLYR